MLAITRSVTERNSWALGSGTIRRSYLRETFQNIQLKYTLELPNHCKCVRAFFVTHRITIVWDPLPNGMVHSTHAVMALGHHEAEESTRHVQARFFITIEVRSTAGRDPIGQRFR